MAAPIIAYGACVGMGVVADHYVFRPVRVGAIKAYRSNLRATLVSVYGLDARACEEHLDRNSRKFVQRDMGRMLWLLSRGAEGSPPEHLQGIDACADDVRAQNGAYQLLRQAALMPFMPPYAVFCLQCRAFQGRLL
jgi:hypothetical protein